MMFFDSASFGKKKGEKKKDHKKKGKK